MRFNVKADQNAAEAQAARIAKLVELRNALYVDKFGFSQELGKELKGQAAIVDIVSINTTPKNHPHDMESLRLLKIGTQKQAAEHFKVWDRCTKPSPGPEHAVNFTQRTL